MCRASKVGRRDASAHAANSKPAARRRLDPPMPPGHPTADIEDMSHTVGADLKSAPAFAGAIADRRWGRPERV
jgi:hypothetical protein